MREKQLRLRKISGACSSHKRHVLWFFRLWILYLFELTKSMYPIISDSYSNIHLIWNTAFYITIFNRCWIWCWNTPTKKSPRTWRRKTFLGRSCRRVLIWASQTRYSWTFCRVTVLTRFGFKNQNLKIWFHMPPLKTWLDKVLLNL